jgi:hypothetical protein
VLRRRDSRREGPRRIGELFIDPARREVRVGDREVRLANKEFSLLRALAADPHRVFRKDELLPPGRPCDRAEERGPKKMGVIAHGPGCHSAPIWRCPYSISKEQDMPSGYINPRIHINPPRPHRPSHWLRFRTWWKETDLDSQLAERVDRVQRRQPSSRRDKSYRGLTMALVPPGSSPHPAFNLDTTGSSYRGLTMGLVPPGSSPHPAFNLDTTGSSYRGLTMGLVPPGSSPHPAFNLDVTGSRSKEQRHALRTHQPGGRIRAGVDHG